MSSTLVIQSTVSAKDQHTPSGQEIIVIKGHRTTVLRKDLLLSFSLQTRFRRRGRRSLADDISVVDSVNVNCYCEPNEKDVKKRMRVRGWYDMGSGAWDLGRSLDNQCRNISGRYGIAKSKFKLQQL